jgi:hypothetical protein
MNALDKGPVGFVINGCCGAFLAALAAVSVQWWWHPSIDWTFVKICAGFGFFLAAFFGQTAIDFLTDVLKWS